MPYTVPVFDEFVKNISLTGDHHEVARRICREALWIDTGSNPDGL